MAEVFGFNESDARKTIEMIGGGGGVSIRDSEVAFPDDGPSTAIGYLTTSVTARSGTTLGSGTARLQKVSGGVVSDYTEVDGSTTYSFTVYNTTTKTLSTDQYVQLKKEYVSGTWLVDVASCS